MTPTSYLELIATFRLLLAEKRDAVMAAKHRYTNGLDKLALAESQVCASPFRFCRSCLFLAMTLITNALM